MLNRVVSRNASSRWITAEEITELFEAIGAPRPTSVVAQHKVTVGVKSITFSVPGIDRNIVEENLRYLAGEGFDPKSIASVELDWSTVKGLPEDSGEYSPGETDDEIRATRARIETGIRDWVIEQHLTHGRWCAGGINEVLMDLGLEKLPKRREYRVSRQVTGTWYDTVDAHSPEHALKVAEANVWNTDDDGDMMNGYFKPKDLGAVTVEED